MVLVVGLWLAVGEAFSIEAVLSDLLVLFLLAVVCCFAIVERLWSLERKAIAHLSKLVRTLALIA